METSCSDWPWNDADCRKAIEACVCRLRLFHGLRTMRVDHSPMAALECCGRVATSKRHPLQSQLLDAFVVCHGSLFFFFFFFFFFFCIFFLFFSFFSLFLLKRTENVAVRHTTDWPSASRFSVVEECGFSVEIKRQRERERNRKKEPKHRDKTAQQKGDVTVDNRYRRRAVVGLFHWTGCPPAVGVCIMGTFSEPFSLLGDLAGSPRKRTRPTRIHYRRVEWKARRLTVCIQSSWPQWSPLRQLWSRLLNKTTMLPFDCPRSP